MIASAHEEVRGQGCQSGEEDDNSLPENFRNATPDVPWHGTDPAISDRSPWGVGWRIGGFGGVF